MSKDFFKVIHNEINEIESHINVESYFYENIELWPIFRLGYYICKKKQISNYTKKSLFNRLISKIKTIYLRASFFLRKRAEINNISTLYIGSNSHRTSIDGKFINRYFNHLIDNKSMLIEYSNRLLKIDSNAIDLNMIIKDFKHLTVKHIKSLDKLEIDLKFLNLDNKIIEDTILFTLNVINYSTYFKAFLSNSVVSQIYFLSYYSSPALGICIAANELNIKTIEVQHGPIGKYHLAYCKLVKKRFKNFKAIPDEIHIWHDSYRKVVEDTFKSVVTTGNYYLNEHVTLNKKNKKNKILISLQPKDNILSQLYLNIITKFYSDCLIVLRLHPRIIISFKFKKQLKKLKKEHGIIISNPYRRALHEDLKDVFVHVTGYSGTTIEALSLGIDSLLIDIKAVHFFENFKNEEKIIFGHNMEINEIFKIIEKLKCS